jgi:integrase
MENDKKRFKLVRFAFETQSGGMVYRYMITDYLIPMFEINQWIESRSLQNANTGKEYAKKLVVYLNYLHSIGVEYDAATNRYVKSFIHYLLYGGLEELKLKFLETEVVCATAGRYLTAITELYKWLANNYETNITFQTKTDTYRARKSFLYGQIYSYGYQYILDSSLPRQKSRREYIKWYSEAEKDALCGHFETLRDEAVFRITLEGFRIDEVLSMQLQHYDPVEQTIRPSRSKGKQSARSGRDNPLRVVALPSSFASCSPVHPDRENDCGKRERRHQRFSFHQPAAGQYTGKPLRYGNYYAILKRCAQRAGLDPEKIRTHSGRSTKVMEYLGVRHSIRRMASPMPHYGELRLALCRFHRPLPEPQQSGHSQSGYGKAAPEERWRQ